MNSYLHHINPLPVIVAVLLLLGSCVKNEVSVEINLPAKINDAYKLTYYASDPAKGFFIETVAAVQQGKGKVTLPMRNPTLVFITDNSPIPRAVFYIERGDKIKITGDDGNPISWDIKGNDLTEEWTQWRIASRSAISSADAAKINAAVEGYVKKNPEKPLATLLLLTYYDRRADSAGFEKLWESLKGKALEPKWIQLASRSDMITNSPLFPQKTGSIILHSLGNGVDTLNIGSKPAILFFWRDNDSERENGIRTLKKLADEFSDSSSRIISDICFDPDSISWTLKARRDSTSKIVRGWELRAETDSVMMRLGVERTPWYLVFDTKGARKYAGDNAETADSIFRKYSK